MRRLAFLAAIALPAQPLKFFMAPDAVVEARLRRIVNDNRARAELLHQLFEEAGCTAPNLEDRKARGSKLFNVVCALPGETDDLVIVSAHYDKVKDGAGAVDNWTGASLLPSLFQGFSQVEKRKHTFLFIGFTDEEVGLVGSRAWVDEHRKTALGKVRAVVNIDSVATGPLLVWASRAHPSLLAAAERVAGAMKIPISGMNVDNVGDSDSAPFHAKKIPVIDCHSLTSETFKILHSPRDQLEAVKIDELLATNRFLSAYLAVVDSLPPLPTGKP